MRNAEVAVAIEPLLTREQTAELLGMSVSWVRSQVRCGKLRQVKLGKLVRIEPQDLRNFIARYRDDVGINVGTPNIPGLFGPDSVKWKTVDIKRS